MNIYQRLQEVLGIDLQQGANVVSLNVGSFAANRAYSIDDVGGNASFVMTAGNQTIGGTKTFTNGLSTGSFSIISGSYTYTLGSAPLTASRVVLFPDSNGALGQALITDGSGNLSWSTIVSGIAIGTPANGLAFNVGTNTLTIGLASSTDTGALSSADWLDFNSKQAALSFGSINTSTSGVTVGNGTASTVGPNVTVDISTANSTQNGLLSSVDWGTFNSKLTRNPLITAGTSTKITYDVNGLVTSGTSLIAADIPSLDASIITSGQLGIANGGTGQSTSSAAFNALSPLTHVGDLIGYNSGSVRFPVGPDGQILTADSTSPVGFSWKVVDAVTTIGLIDGQLPSSNGAVITGDFIVLQSASSSAPGLMNLSTQTFSGAKTFSGGITASLTGAASLNVLKTGDSMTGTLNMGSNAIVNLLPPVNTNDGATKGYVDNLAVGIIPQSPVVGAELVDDSLTSPPVSPTTDASYIIAGTPTGAWSSFVAGDKVTWTGTVWKVTVNGPIQVGERFGVNFNNSIAPLGGNMVGHQDAIATVTNATPGSFAYTFETPSYRWTTFNNGTYSDTYGSTYYYNGTKWTLISSGFDPIPGSAISVIGQTINVLYDSSSISINGINQLEVIGVGGSLAAAVNTATVAVNSVSPYSVLGNTTNTAGTATSQTFVILGVPGYSDTGILGQFTSSLNSYNQIIVQNTDAGAVASTNFIISNNLGTSSGYFGEVGMNSSNFAGAGAFNAPNAMYVDNSNGPLAIGTLAGYPISFVVNNGSSDAMTIAPSGFVGIGNMSPSYELDVNGSGRFSGSLLASNLSGTNTGDQTITLTGEVTGSGVGSFAATISAGAVTIPKLATITDGVTLDQSGSGSSLEIKLLGVGTGQLATNAVTNAKLAQMAANTIKGNNTGSPANALDLTATQVTAMLNPFVGDSGTGGTQGLVPAPPAYSNGSGEFLSASGSWVSVDQSKPSPSSFAFVKSLANSGGVGTYKMESTTIFTSITTGHTYAIGVGFVSTTFIIWDITDQTNPVLVCTVPAAGGGAYNCTVGVVAGVQYVFVGYNSGAHFVVYNLANPAAPALVANKVVTGSPGSLYGVSFLNGYVYVATQNTGLVVMDVGGGTGSPAAPVQTYQQAGGIKSFGVWATGTNVYTTAFSTSSPFTVRQIMSWTLAGAGTPAIPSLLQSLQVTAAGEALGIGVYGNTAFVTTSAAGAYNINLVDITTPSAMTNLSTINSTNAFGSALYAVASGNYLYVPSGGNATYGTALDLYDISARTAPVHIAQVTTGHPSAAGGVPALYNGYIFVADYGVAASDNGYLDVFTQPSTASLSVSPMLYCPILVQESSLANPPVNGMLEYDGTHLYFTMGSTRNTIIVGSAGITSLTGDVTASGTGSVAATVAFVGGSSASLVHSAELAANAATSANTVGTIVKRDASGNFSAGTITSNLTGNVTGNLLGNVTGNVSGSSGSCTGNSATATFASSSGSFTGSLSGDVTGTQISTVVSFIGGVSAANVALGVNAANGATSSNVVSTLVARDPSGNFSAGTITASLSGNVTGNVTGNVSGSSGSCTGNSATATFASASALFIGSLAGDVTGTQGATTVSMVGGESAAALVAAAPAVQTNLNHYIDPTGMQFGWDYTNPHYYTQLSYTGSVVTGVTYWDSPSMTTQIFTKSISYTGSLPTSIVVTRISDGKTLTKTMTYVGIEVSTVTRT